MDDILIVDGYNVIGAWPHLRDLRDNNLDQARDLLIESIADYQGFSGMRCIVVFDAYNVPGLGRQYNLRKVEVYYTKEKETADECIERLVKQLARRRRQIYVATSDFTEQNVAFGSGALRLSARELLVKVKQSEKEVAERVREKPLSERNTFDKHLSGELRTLFEKWRKGQ
ncbi:NYN domain-containing protein [Paenibacillus sp.]|uniref:NYN domain-containing protein n=1 Tax=Paenibacillus sp. TaxID=58172 RepID=UPI002D2E4C26|nr:NYN domain-containing protein [Paenibacillus sp.]HZG55496.1 NYN domain-containing protein [Paenibacillus sp.]